MQKKLILIFGLVLALFVFCRLSYAQGDGFVAKASCEPQGTLIIFHAGSLTIPFARMEKEFEARYPKIDIQREASGSQKAARKISELKKPCDIIASADYKVIDKLLIPNFAEFNIRFATNQMVLCYTDTSKYGNEITPHNWFEILLKKDIIWGHSDPNLDPCGYRSLMVLQLAEEHYKKPGLYERLLANRPQENIRPKSVELISLLQTGNMDYAWEYLSVAVQHGLKYIILPDEINLRDYRYDDRYAKAVVKVTGKQPGTFMDMKGRSITYGVTMVKNSPNHAGAVAFLKFMLDSQGGLKILQEMGQPPFLPSRVPNEKMKQSLPKELHSVVGVKK